MLPTLCRKSYWRHTVVVPRISAATVPEHRDAQRRALLRAAAELIVSSGVAAVTPTSVGERAGIARTSVYDYFGSREDLLVAVAINAFEEWSRDLASALDGAESGIPRLRRYIDATMAMAADGRHNLATALRPADLSPRRVEEIAALHEALRGPLHAILIEAGVDEAAVYEPYIQSVIGAGLARVVDGEDPHDAAARIQQLIIHGFPRANSQ